MEKLNILIISGLLAGEHDMVRINGYLRTMLESTGRFRVRVTEDFRGATMDTLCRYDAVLMNYDGKEWYNDPLAEYWGDATNEVLFRYVKNGGGIIFYHSAVGAYPETPLEYRRMQGMSVDMTAGARKNPSKDDFIVDVRTDHPITAGLKPHFMAVGDDFVSGLTVQTPASIEVLATVYDALEDYQVPGFPPAHTSMVRIPEAGLAAMKDVNTDVPVIWTNRYGAGRVFALTIGHDIDTMRRIEFLTILVRGCEWAATGSVTLDPPDRKGDARLHPWPWYQGNRS